MKPYEGKHETPEKEWENMKPCEGKHETHSASTFKLVHHRTDDGAMHQ